MVPMRKRREGVQPVVQHGEKQDVSSRVYVPVPGDTAVWTKCVSIWRGTDAVLQIAHAAQTGGPVFVLVDDGEVVVHLGAIEQGLLDPLERSSAVAFDEPRDVGAPKRDKSSPWWPRWLGGGGGGLDAPNDLVAYSVDPATATNKTIPFQMGYSRR